MESERFVVEIVAEAEVPASLPPLLQESALATLRQQGVPPPAALTLLLADDARLHSLNRAFLDEDRPTDVLSFAAGPLLPGEEPYLGDVALSLPAARRQAAEAGHSLEAECALLVVHGVLHLLGHDHQEAEEKTVMWQAQKAVLQGLGVEVEMPA